jgi:hypothetical protein
MNAPGGSQTFKQIFPVEKPDAIQGIKRNGAGTAPSGARITGAAQMQGSRFFLSEDSATERPRWRLWRGRALIFGLILASTAALLLCPCDCPGQNPHAILLIAISVLIGSGAAILVYREMRRRSDITAFLKAAIAIGIVIIAVYAEFTVAMDLIAWLARRGR